MFNKNNKMRDTNRLYDSLIEIQKKSEVTGPVKPLDSYELHAKLWAETRFLKGRNFYAARAANVKTDVEFVTRYREDLDETMRVKFNDKFYNIEGILPLDNNRMYMIIKAYEIKHDM